MVVGGLLLLSSIIWVYIMAIEHDRIKMGLAYLAELFSEEDNYYTIIEDMQEEIEKLKQLDLDSMSEIDYG